MGRLSDFLRTPDRDRYIDSRLKPGQVLYLYCDFITPEHRKYLVLLVSNAKPRPLFFFINSRVHPFAQRRPELLACQVRIGVGTYDFLDHDSYIDCSRVIDDLDYQEIKRQLGEDVTRIKGELDANTKALITQAVAAAVTISEHHKRLITQALGG